MCPKFQSLASIVHFHPSLCEKSLLLHRTSLLKTFNKTLEEGFFPVVVVDAPNTKVHHFDRYWSNGKMKGFEVYVAELVDSVEICVARNIHHRSKEDIQKVQRRRRRSIL